MSTSPPAIPPVGSTAPATRPDPSPSQVDKAPSDAGWLRHPITVTFVGAFLSVLIIPIISVRLSDRRLIDDARLRGCMEIIKNSMDIDQRLNTMITMIEMYVHDPTATPTSWRQGLPQINAAMTQQYLEFDKTAWWWISRLPLEAKLLRIEVDTKLLGPMLTDYKSNLERATKAVAKLRDRSLKKENKPRDEGLRKLAKEARNELNDLQGQRQVILGRLIFLFAPPEHTIQKLIRQD